MLPPLLVGSGFWLVSSALGIFCLATMSQVLSPFYAAYARQILGGDPAQVQTLSDGLARTATAGVIGITLGPVLLALISGWWQRRRIAARDAQYARVAARLRDTSTRVDQTASKPS